MNRIANQRQNHCVGVNIFLEIFVIVALIGHSTHTRSRSKASTIFEEKIEKSFDQMSYSSGHNENKWTKKAEKIRLKVSSLM